MRSRIGIVAALAAVSCFAAPSLAGPDWIEGAEDAGSTILTAQKIVGVGDLLRISGKLSLGSARGVVSLPDYEDLFLLTISQPTLFSFTVASANFDPQLFLFNITIPGEALGLLANNDTVLGNLPVLTSPATDGTGAMVLLPGSYALGVSGVGRVPVSLTGPIFNFASTTEVSGSDGVGGINPLYDWTGTGQTGGYEIDLVGCDYFDVPAPSACSLLLLGGALSARRRR